MTKSSWGRLLFIFFGLIVLGLSSAFLSLRFFIKGTEVTVPALEGQNIVDALEKLNQLNLRLEIEEQEFNAGVPSHYIIAQHPPAGSTIKAGRKVRIILSRGSQLVKIPTLLRTAWHQAQSVLHKEGLGIGTLARVYNYAPSQEIIGQSPPAGFGVKRGTKVNLLVSKGPMTENYLMPDFIGQQVDSVTRRLKIMNASLGKVGQIIYQGISPGIVIDQSPPSGFRIQQGNLVDVTVSQ
ncbi:MAG: PASTA domain-containing protein [Candidatus Schekmanbacteria bacterium]|nr:PASTA domain-containing protein [Candidatus Schekmanbacteria bacterium]